MPIVLIVVVAPSMRLLCALPKSVRSIHTDLATGQKLIELKPSKRERQSVFEIVKGEVNMSLDNGWYMLEYRHSSSIPMRALQNLDGGGLNFYGLYMLCLDNAILTDGELQQSHLLFFARDLAKLDEDKLYSFINCCIANGVMTAKKSPENELNAFIFPQAKEYLARKAKSKEASSKGGQVTQQRRAEANSQNSGPLCYSDYKYTPR